VLSPRETARILRVDPHPGQARLWASWREPVRVVHAGRRWGKSFALAVEAVHYALARPGSIQLIASVSIDQARVVFDAVRRFLEENPLLRHLVDWEETVETPFPTLAFRTGSVITARSTVRGGKYIRGHGFDRAIVDECEYIDDRIIDEVIRPALLDRRGSLILSSTPRRIGSAMWRERLRLSEARPTAVVWGPTWENPRISPEDLEALRARMTASQWRREIEGLWAEEEGAIFRLSDIMAAYESADWVLPEEPRPGRVYAAGADLAKLEDWTVIAILDATEEPFRLVYFERFQRQPWPMVADRLREVFRRYRARALVDATGVGEAVMDLIRDVADGVVFTPKVKSDLVSGLALALERRRIRFPFIRELVEELQAYQADDKGLSTDCVMALALAVAAAGHRVESVENFIW